MLHATAQNKSPLFRRYLPLRDRGERVQAEDEITSTVFGPLAFLDAGACFRACSLLLQRVVRAPGLPIGAPATANVQLWPSGAAVEPDLLVSFSWPDGRRLRLLVELKWRAGLSGEDQLHRQWAALGRGAEAEDVWHLLIAHGAPRTVARILAQDRKHWNREGIQRLAGLDWQQVRDVLAACKTEVAQLAEWGRLANTFLEMVGVRRFDGFQHPELPTNWQPPVHTPFFSGGKGAFRGFTSCSAPAPLGSGPSFNHSSQPMNAGALLSNSLEVASKYLLEVNQLGETLQNLIWEELQADDLPVKIGTKVITESRTDASDWIAIDWAKSFPLYRRGRKGKGVPDMFFGFQISMAGAGTAPSCPPEPVLHMFLWTEPCNFKTADHMGYPLAPEYAPNVDGGPLITWDSGYKGWLEKQWVFSVRLLALNSTKALMDSLVVPAIALLREGPSAHLLPPDMPGLLMHSPDRALPRTAMVSKE